MSNSDTDLGPHVTTELSDHVLWLRLNRPARRNPLSAAMIEALSSAISTAGGDTAVRAIVIAADGPVFSAGHDLWEMRRRDDEGQSAHRQRVSNVLRLCSEMMLDIVHCPKAIIACVQGTATAAGCQLVSACDLAIAADGALFCTPGVNIGAFCTTPLVGIGRNIHRKHAMELALTGDLFSAQDAVRFGLINRAVPASQLRAQTAELAAKIAAKSSQGIRQGKEPFYRQIDMPIEQAFEYANEAMVDAMTSTDALEGTSAFLDKRAPRWEGD